MNESLKQKSILILAANPKKSINLRLQEEEREIKERLRLAGYGRVPVNSTGAVRPRDIQQAMLDFKPQIVHFSGHGAGQDGLVFEDAAGQGKLISSEALADLFKLFSNRVECVILNACYSKFQAEAIAQHINFVVGMSEAIGDRAAIEFSVGFYSAIGADESYEFAYNMGCNAIHLEGILEKLTPIVFRKGRLLSVLNISQLESEDDALANQSEASDCVIISYTDPEEYTGLIWTQVIPYHSDAEKNHLITIIWGSYGWEQVMFLPAEGLLLVYQKRNKDCMPRIVTVSPTPKGY